MKTMMPSLAVALLLVACSPESEKMEMSNISENTITQLCKDNPSAEFEKAVRHCASLWRSSDGSEAQFASFVEENYLTDSQQKQALFERLERAFELFLGSSNQLTIDLQKPVILAGDQPMAVDYMLAAYSADAHFQDDMYESKLAFITALNFPYYTLSEKNALASSWDRTQWAYARMGDMFQNRIPSSVKKKAAAQLSEAENYIADYNIMMGHLLTEDGRRLFPEDMILLSHWNLRDQLKSDYADVPNANEKQEMIYQVMQRIACQDIPVAVVNNPEYDWAPYSNKVFKNGKAVDLPAEGAVRYQQILNHFHINQLLDAYNPGQPSGIIRNFDGSMEVSAEEIESLFVKLVSSPQVARTAALIRSRLGRELRPYDIWYDGFKSRSTMPEDVLTAQTRKLYPDTKAFKQDMPRMLRMLGFSPERAEYIADKIEVEGARGSGHAWQTAGRGYQSFLRTRIAESGMDYKGYNIAVHEFGHNVEQTIDMYYIDHYMLSGVPNSAFTETLAFVFQKRDLQMLGYDSPVDDNTILDIFWGMYEIMGVSLVDMYTWRWLYEHPQASAEELRDNCLRIAREVWNKYYEPVLGTHDSPVLAIYSHMVNSPMYLPNYPFGHIIEFQIEEHFASLPDPKCLGPEIERIYRLGRLTPQEWMRQAVGSPVSIEPVLAAVDRILEK